MPAMEAHSIEASFCSGKHSQDTEAARERRGQWRVSMSCSQSARRFVPPTGQPQQAHRPPSPFIALHHPCC